MRKYTTFAELESILLAAISLMEDATIFTTPLADNRNQRKIFQNHRSTLENLKKS